MTRGGGELGQYGAPSAGADGGRVSHRFARERDRSGRHEFERGEQVRGFATYQGEKLGERGAHRELQPGGRAADRQGREAQHAPVTMPRVPLLPTKQCLTS